MDSFNAKFERPLSYRPVSFHIWPLTVCFQVHASNDAEYRNWLTRQKLRNQVEAVAAFFGRCQKDKRSDSDRNDSTDNISDRNRFQKHICFRLFMAIPLMRPLAPSACSALEVVNLDPPQILTLPTLRILYR